MGQDITLTASDGHSFGAYRCDPAGVPLGGVVVIQEIFGVNDHIRDVTERFAALVSRHAGKAITRRKRGRPVAT